MTVHTRTIQRATGLPLKTQAIRLVDVFVLGPFLIWVSLRPRQSNLVRVGIAVAGIATILFNGANYLRLERGEGGITEGP